MKKLLTSFFLIALFLTGCTEKLNNTPTKKVEMFFMNYQTLNQDVIAELNNTLDSDTTMTDEQKEKYKDIMKKHYKDLVYDIKDEQINGNTALVTAEIEVYDYSKTLASISSYMENNKDEFLDETNNFDNEKYMDYRLEELSKVKEKVKYTLDMTLTKIDDEWQLDPITDIDENKILGIYEY